MLNVAADDTSSPVPTAQLLDEYHPGVPYFAELTGHASLFDTTACARLLGFAPEYGRSSPDADAGAGAGASAETGAERQA